MLAEVVGQGQASEDVPDPFVLIGPRWRRSTLGLFDTCAEKSGGLALPTSSSRPGYKASLSKKDAVDTLRILCFSVSVFTHRSKEKGKITHA